MGYRSSALGDTECGGNSHSVYISYHYVGRAQLSSILHVQSGTFGLRFGYVARDKLARDAAVGLAAGERQLVRLDVSFGIAFAQAVLVVALFG